MLRIAALAGLGAFLSSSLFAQSPLSAQPIPGAIRNAGTYHVDTGTWTRGGQQLTGFNPDVLYDNTAQSGYFTTAGMANATGDWSWIDEGRIPSDDSDIPGARFFAGQVVNGISFSYCTDSAAPIGITFQLYESYEPCDLIRTAPSSPFLLSGSIAAPALPASPMGGISCWTVTLDAGVGFFFFGPDGGQAFPDYEGDLDFDSFGIEWIFNGAAGTETGPVLAGDPQWTASETGVLLHGGTGTYYTLTSGSCANTGLDTQDFVAADQPTTGLPGPDCYFFGGYQNPTNGCGGPSQVPFSSFSTTVLGGVSICLATCNDFCVPAGVNSSGTAAQLTAESTSSGAGFRLEASGGPQLANSGFGYFVVSSGIGSPVNIGDGALCLQSPLGRYSPSGPAALNSLGKFNLDGDFENLSGTSTTGFGFDLPTQLPTPPGGSIQAGSTWHFQLWYRDLNPGPAVNFSNGVSLGF